MILPDGVAAAIVAHAREEAPRECCGLLVGTQERITEAVRASNIAADPRRQYLVDPRDHLAAVRLSRARGEQVIGAYHSHPRSPAVPSATDAAEGFSHFLFIIVSLAAPAPALSGWRWEDGNFAAVPLVRLP